MLTGALFRLTSTLLNCWRKKQKYVIYINLKKTYHTAVVQCCIKFLSFAENQVAEIFAEPIRRFSDFNITFGEKKFLNLTHREANVTGDFLKVTVRFRDGSERNYFHASVSEISDVAHRKETHRSPLNIMILVLDRTSAAHFQRMLPKTYAFLKDELDSIMFKSYSIVGENTTPAMSAFLTGKSLEENCKFKEARKGVENASFVDEWPFIFKDLKRLGIATMWSEDQPNIGKFLLFYC